MNILIFAIGTRGDVQPFVALGTALAARGHQVTISAPLGFTEMIEAAGLAAAPIPMDIQALMEEPEIKAAMTSLSGRLKAFRWATDIMNTQLQTIWDVGHEVRPDLILNHFKGATAAYLARKFGVPSIPVALQPGLMTTGDYPQFIFAKSSLGRRGNIATHKMFQTLTRVGTNVMVKRWLKVSGVDLGPKMDLTQGFHPNGPATRLHAFAPTICPRPTEWPETEVQTGYFFTDPTDWTPPDDLAAFLDAGEQPIYVGFGSMPGMDHARTTKALLGALQSTGLRAVIATGWGGIGDLAPGPNVHVLAQAPHAWLFPRMAAVVHHGGSGTTHEALRWGRPSVVCPLFADQPFFGERVHALGAGPAPIRQKKLTADGLAAALKVALSDPVRARATEIGATLRAEDGVAQAIEAIEAIR